MEPEKKGYREDEYHKDIRERLEALEKWRDGTKLETESPKFHSEPFLAQKRKPGRPPKNKENP